MELLKHSLKISPSLSVPIEAIKLSLNPNLKDIDWIQI